MKSGNELLVKMREEDGVVSPIIIIIISIFYSLVQLQFIIVKP